MTSSSEEIYYQWDRMVVACALHGEKFIGWVPKEVVDPREYMIKCMTEGSPCELIEVRILASQLRAEPDGQGGIASIGNLLVMMPVDMFPQGMERHFIKLSTFYFPSDNDGCKPIIENLLRDARQMEARRAVRKSAEEAGIIIPRPKIITERK